MRVVRGLLGAAVLLAACQPVPPPKRAVEESVPVKPALIHGRAFFLERMLLAPGATLDVLLVGERGDAPPATIAQGHFDGLHGPPYDFDLPYDPTKIDPGTRYGLRANLRNAEGHLEFATDARVAVTPGDAQRVEFRLVRAGTH
jgi:uncharacterized lipoprotein YbaY